VEVGADRPLARYGRRGGSRPRGTWSWWAASDGEEALELLEGEPEGVGRGPRGPHAPRGRRDRAHPAGRGGAPEVGV